MDVRYLPTPEHFKRMNTQEVRQRFLIEQAFRSGEINLTYSHVDRMVIGSIVPANSAIALEAGKELAADYFHERRETGVFNIGNTGSVTVDGTGYTVANKEMLYIGRGSKAVSFSSAEASDPAKFFLISLPAHTDCPTAHIALNDANRVDLGDQDHANKRTIYQYIHEGGVQSCQLVMGFTALETGSVWNTMPAHTHERRSEVYMYFELEGEEIVFHMMGQAEETRHIIMRQGDAVISPSWSIHAGAGTSNYCFIWAMGGENQAFNDMDGIPLSEMA